MPRFIPNKPGIVISGKYGPDWQPVYEVRRAFTAAGMDVAFPLGDAPRKSYNGYTFSDPLEEYISFENMQERFFRGIEDNPFHVVCPGRLDRGRVDRGYVGFSTAHEICWAISKAKPVIITSQIDDISRYLPMRLHEIVRDAEELFIPLDPRELGVSSLRRALKGLPRKVDYHISDQERKDVFNGYCKLLRIERHRWLSWTQKTERDYAAGLRSNWINEREMALYEEPAAYLPMEEMINDPDALMYLRGAHKQNF